MAVRLHCNQHWQLLSSLGRRPYHDIDFWGLRKDQPKIERFFAEQGYIADPKCKHLHEWGIKRLIFEHPGSAVKVDVFMDELVMAHTIDFKDRLLLDYPCVPLADLLLSKLQIHEITENDLMDLVVLLFEHPFGSGERQIEIDHVARVLARDWCFWYEATLNIGKIRLAARPLRRAWRSGQGDARGPARPSSRRGSRPSRRTGVGRSGRRSARGSAGTSWSATWIADAGSEDAT